MVEWFAWVQIVSAVVAGVLCLVLGTVGRRPNDYSLGSVLVVEALLLIQLVVAVLAPVFGNEPAGSALEFYIYLISALLLLPLAGFWGLVERTRWSTLILGVACLAAAVMAYRMLHIWSVHAG